MTFKVKVWHERYLQTQTDDYGPSMLRFLERGQATAATDYVKAQHARTRLRRYMLAGFTDVDYLLTLGTWVPALERDARTVVIRRKEVKLLGRLVFITCRLMWRSNLH